MNAEQLRAVLTDCQFRTVDLDGGPKRILVPRDWNTWVAGWEQVLWGLADDREAQGG